jgi:RNA polymerase sigma-70 factor (ECF subfamily)
VTQRSDSDAREYRAAAESILRTEGPRIVSALIRKSGSFDLAEDALQEALASAFVHWPRAGVPRNPGAWIMAVAQRKLIDFARRKRTQHNAVEALIYESAQTTEQPPAEIEPTEEYPDDRLRLIFTCCHPALNLEARIALTLRTLGRLTTTEIARAFLLPEATLAQRIVRAKTKIREARIPYEVPAHDGLPERLESVLAVIYLIFNESYSATAGEMLVRSDLAAEAIRLGRTLRELLTREPEVLGLLALMLLHDSRRDARVNCRGELVPLEEQDRLRWHHPQIDEGMRTLGAAITLGRPGPYQLQAAIAATHARATTADATDWPEIAALYGQLVRLSPTPVVALNHAVAVAMAEGLAEGLDRVDRLGAFGSLDGYRLYHASRADLLRRLGRREEARSAYERALALTTNRVEEAYLRRRVTSLG